VAAEQLGVRAPHKRTPPPNVPALGTMLETAAQLPRREPFTHEFATNPPIAASVTKPPLISSAWKVEVKTYSMRSGWLSSALWIALVFVSLTPPTAAVAQSSATPAGNEQQARTAFERGRIHYDNGEFDAAAAAFEEAYRLSGREGLLYNIYLAYRDASAEEQAAEALRSFLAHVEVIENRAQLESRLKALDEGIRQKQAEQAEAQRLEEQRRNEEQHRLATTVVAPSAEAAPKPRWWLVPVSVMGAGGALALGSVVTGVMAQNNANQLEDNCHAGQCDERFRSTADSGHALAVTTDVLLFGGLATVAVGGALLYFKRPREAAPAPEPRTSAAVICTRSLCGGSVALRF
jgi:tetratricopeptide (TPR) repeat protein